MQVNKILNKRNSLLSINNAYSFLFGMLGSMVIFSIFYYLSVPPPRIAVVNITAIVKDFVNKESKQNKQQDVLTKDVKQFGLYLEKTLKMVAKNNNVILMPSEAIIAGSQDYTFIIKKKIQSVSQKYQDEKDD